MQNFTSDGENLKQTKLVLFATKLAPFDYECSVESQKYTAVTYPVLFLF